MSKRAKFNIPEEIKEKFEKEKSFATIETYKTMLSKLFREVFETNEASLSLLKNTSRVEKYLEKISITSAKLITIAVVMLLKAANSNKEIIDTYGKLAKKYRILDKEMRRDRLPTDAEREAYMPWDSVIALRREYRKLVYDHVTQSNRTALEYERLFMKFIVLCLFTYIPPQRGEVYFKCKINKHDPSINTIDLEKNILVIREHKTKKSYGIRTIVLPHKLEKFLKDWMDIRTCKSDLLICNSQGHAMSSPGFTQFMKTIFKRSISTDMLR